jgi:ligand-binding sensor domain-containing protein
MISGLILITACSEYGINEKTDPNPGGEDPNDNPVDGSDTDIPEDEETVELAKAPVYANTSTTLYEVEPSTGAHTWVGDFQQNGSWVENFVDIAIDQDGRMYGGTYEALYRIDPTTAEVIYLCDAGHEMTAMAFSSDGELFVGGQGSIHVMDVKTCSTHSLVDSTYYETSGDLVGLPDGYLYWTVRGDDNDELVRVDPNNGSTAWVGEVHETRLYGLGYADGQLFGFSSRGKVVRISPIGASSSVMVDNDELSWWGATTNPVTW